MKYILLVGLCLCVAPFPGQGQDQYVWLRLSGDRVMTDARYLSVNAETLLVVRGGRVVGLDLEDVVQIRFMNGSSMIQGAAVGAGCGLAAGACVAFSLRAFGRDDTPVATTMVVFTVIGGIVGGTVAALEKDGDLISLENLNKSSKAARISEAAKLMATS